MTMKNYIRQMMVAVKNAAYIEFWQKKYKLLLI
jgi:hypothetical protein